MSVNICILSLRDTIQEKNRLITIKKGNNKLSLCRGNGEQLIPFYELTSMLNVVKR